LYVSGVWLLVFVCCLVRLELDVIGAVVRVNFELAMAQVAFPVEGELSPATGVPTNGVEYLMQVRYQARRTRLRPAVHLSTAPHTAPQRVAAELWCATVCDEWQRSLLASFTALRESVTALCASGGAQSPPLLPGVNDEQAWRQWIFAHRQQPSMRIIARMGDVRVRAVLEFASGWFRERDSLLCERRARWLFALLAAVELPLDADTAAALMSLYQSLKRLRARSAPDDLAAFDVLLTVIGFGFNQRDENFSL
jgi:hypothetical protein